MDEKISIIKGITISILVFSLVIPFINATSDIYIDPSDPGFGSRDFPQLIIYLIVALSVFIFAANVYKLLNGYRENIDWSAVLSEAKVILALMLIMLTYVWFIALFQYAVATLIVMMVCVYFFGSRGPMRIVIIPLFSVCIFYFIFFVIFGLYEEPGIVFSYDSYSVSKVIRDAIGM